MHRHLKLSTYTNLHVRSLSVPQTNLQPETYPTRKVCSSTLNAKPEVFKVFYGLPTEHLVCRLSETPQPCGAEDPKFRVSAFWAPFLHLDCKNKNRKAAQSLTRLPR